MKAKKRFLASILTFSVAITTFAKGNDNTIVRVVDRPSQGSICSYTTFRSPLKASALVPLPVGSIKAEGWLARWLELQCQGLNGHLGEVSEWLEKDGNQWLDTKGGDHGWEEVPYWLRGYSNLAYLLGDAKMLKETQIWIEAALGNMRADGFLGPVNKTGRGGYEVWPQMIMLWILQDYYDYTGDARVLEAMKRYFHFQMAQPDELFLKEYWENSRGGDNMWSVIWLYNRTGDTSLLPLIDKLHRNTACWTQHDNFPNWHGVNIAQGVREPATYWLLHHDNDTLLQASYRDQELIRQRYGQVPGGMFGADENCRPGYTDPRQGTETCAMIEQMATDEIMMAITGDPLWAENCEDIAFNTLPASYMPDFRSLRYFVAPNMMVSDSKSHHPSIENSGPFLHMNPFSSRCCQHNHGFGWPYYAKHLVMATTDGGLATMLYCANQTRAKVAGGQEVTLTETTHYPFDDIVEFRLSTENRLLRFPLYLRIPSWAKGAEVRINGKRFAVTESAGRYICIDRTWADGDRVSLKLPMSVSVRVWEQNKGSVSVDYGPLTLSLKIAERYATCDTKGTALGDSHWQKDADVTQWPSYEIFADSPWNYALVTGKKHLPVSLKMHKKAWPADDFPFTQESVPLEFEAYGRLVPSWGYDATGFGDVLPDADAPREATMQRIKLIPMGAARLRISAFPEACK